MSNLAWAAGFFDGEGCILLHKRTRKVDWIDWNLRVTAVNTDIRPLEKLKALFGGSIHVMQKVDNRHGYMPSWAWVTSHAKAAEALTMMLPWLTVKREQAELALQSRKHIQRNRRQRSIEGHQILDAIRSQLIALKKQPVRFAEQSNPLTAIAS